MVNKEKKEKLTNEKLKAKFPNQFDMVNSAIGIARDIIRSGRAVQGQNVPLQAIQDLDDETN
jgi:hypothetical protein